MPVYECLTQVGTLDAAQRRRFAEEATRIHTEVTGSRAQFVHVIFPELSPGYMYTAREAGAPAIIRAQIRAGRPRDARESILRQLEAVYLELTGADPKEVMVIVLEVPPDCALSGGMIMPEPNKADEAAFYDAVDNSPSSSPADR